MKNFILFPFMSLIIISTISCSSQQNNDLISSNQYLIGKWVGNGKFLDKNLQHFGLVSFEIEIKKDNTITGKIGDALLIETAIKKAKNFNGFEVYGILDTKLKKDKELNRKHLIILLNLPKGQNEIINKIDADFHLKTNFTFDFGMKVGNVQLVLVK